MSEQDSGILDVEDEDEDEEVTVYHQTQERDSSGVISSVSVLAPGSAFCVPRQHRDAEEAAEHGCLSILGHFSEFCDSICFPLLSLPLLADSAEMPHVTGELNGP